MNNTILEYNKILVVGAGLYGAVIARELAEHFDKQVTIIDTRNHIGGNCYDERDNETNILCHKYGPHIFHTSLEDVWTYINKFTEFNPFNFNYMAEYQGQKYPLPFNLGLINQFYHTNLKPFELDDFMQQEKEKEFYVKPSNLEEQSISLIGRPLYEAFIKNYVAKQWEKDPKDLPASIIQRLPVRNNYNTAYYFDKYVAIPTYGYEHMFKNILEHHNIEIQLNVDFFDIQDKISDDTFIVYTGALDKFFQYKLGHLEYRTVIFEKEVYNHSDHQGTIAVSYVEAKYPYTRICEHKHFYPLDTKVMRSNKTIIFKEYSQLDTGKAPYYPIKNNKNQLLADQYKAQAEKIHNIHFGGRLAQYEYLDMDKTIKQALDYINKLQ